MYWLVLYYGLSPMIIEDGDLGINNPPQTYERCMEKALRASHGDLYGMKPWGIRTPLKIVCQWGPDKAWEFNIHEEYDGTPIR